MANVSESHRAAHDQLSQTLGHTHEQLHERQAQIAKLQGEMAIIKAAAHIEMEKMGVSTAQVERVVAAAACW